MTTLPEFLLARYAEDEAAAKAALGEPSYPHYGDTAAEESWAMAKSEGCAPEGYRFHRMFDPARVLADVKAKRRIVEQNDDYAHLTNDPLAISVHEKVLHFLALPYADHPDYNESWKP